MATCSTRMTISAPESIRDSLLAFTATYTGTYYIDVGAWDEGYAGTYQLSVSTYTPPPLGTVDQLADQLVNGYWGGDDHHFNVTQGGTITVNITGLTAAGQALALIGAGHLDGHHRRQFRRGVERRPDHLRRQ